MVDGGQPVHIRSRRALALGDGDERGIWKSLAHELNVWQVEAAMQGGEKRYAQAPQEWKVHPIQMRMDHIESRGGVGYCFEQGSCRDSRVRRWAAQSKRTPSDWD